jgi:hypothetical protein
MSLTHIDEPRLETDLAYRFGYLCEFIGFGQDDIDAIHGAAPVLAPVVPALVDAVYDKLFQYDATKRHFVPRQSGYTGAVPTHVETLEMPHEMIAFRKQHLTRYLVRLVSDRYDTALVSYLDSVGKIHTPALGSKELNVPLVQMNALMGFVATAVSGTILSFNLPRETETKTLLAFGKLLWIQNDLINRHYQPA